MRGIRAHAKGVRPGTSRDERKAGYEGKRAAFTLIELLVVVAIISLLVSILLPSLNRAKQLAARVHCQMNLHNLGLLMAQYANDFDQKLLPGRFNGNLLWPRPFLNAGYIDVWELWHCPSAPWPP